MDDLSSRLSEPLTSGLSSDNNDNFNVSSTNHVLDDDNHNDGQGHGSPIRPSSFEEEQAEVYHTQTLVYGLFGRPYALYWNFWWQHLISAAVLGALVGCVVGAVLWSHQIVTGLFFPTRSHSDSGGTGGEEQQNKNNNSTNHQELGPWWWILIPAGGAMVASIVLELPRAPKPETFRSIVHDLATLDGNFVQSFHAVISGWIALAMGLPIGVDLVVSTIGSGCAKVIGDVFQVDTRTRALYVQAGLSASLSVLFPSPILGLLLVQELGMAVRPGALTLSSVMNQQRTARNEEDIVEIRPQLANHDVMEQVLVASISTASCTAMISILFPDSAIAGMKLQSYDLARNDVSDGINVYFDWLRAIVLGLIAGAFVTLGGALYLKWSWSRIKGCAFLMYNERLKFTKARLVFATLAGLICGVLGFVWSYPLLFDNGINAWQNILDAKAAGLSAYQVAHFGLHVLLGVAVCIGCGILGGCAFPMLSVGACMGAAVSCHFFPLSLSVPCCMAGCISGFLPAPFTTVLTVSMLFNLDANESTSVLLAALASYAVTGGSGMLSRLCTCAWKMTIDEEEEVAMMLEEDYVRPPDVEIQDERPLADYEIRQEIRSKIFGSPSTGE